MTLQLQTAPSVIPLNTAATLGPWTITLTEPFVGDEAQSMISDKNAENLSAGELGGSDPELAYVLAKFTVQNNSASPRVINLADFGATGSDGILRRPPSIEVPDPGLQTIVPAGESVEGIVPFLVNDSETATVWFDSVLLGGNWATGVFALGSAAAIPVFEITDSEPSDAGDSVESAVAIGEPVRTGGWEITVTDWISGQDVYDLVDYRSRAWAGEDSQSLWRAVKATVTNLNPVPAVFPNDAILVAGGDGEPWDNILQLTAPEPDLSREYLPGATREGWAAFDLFVYPEAPDIPYVRIQINNLVGNPRYVQVGEISSSADDSDTEATTEPEETSLDAEPLDVAVGDIVVTFGEIANLRAEPSTSGDKLKELQIGTELEITGEPVEADGYRWYPVKVMDGGNEGFVVQDYIEPKG